MVKDQPSSPRIRTKINNIDSDIDQEFFDLISAFKTGDIDVNKFQSDTLHYFMEEFRKGNLDKHADQCGPEQQSAWMLKRHIDQCRYSVLCYYVAEGESHPPHHHHNVASTQILMRGKLHLREYDRVGRNDDGELILKLASDRVLQAGDHFQASEWSRNVHWFTAIDGPAVIFNTNARGFEKQTFETDESRFGRLYVDPTNEGSDGKILAEEFDEIEANRRFG